ncbi:MAG: DUF1800 domain-containing protein [Planctomycetes bacterium]|nr:DUF1800 domain-containing protein [Planctomycetota bacterium]
MLRLASLSAFAAGTFLFVSTAHAAAGDGLAWNPRNVEHLLNRAGFGATPAEIEAALAKSPEAFVDELMTPKRSWERVTPVLIRWEDFDLDPRGIPVEPEKSKYKGMARAEIQKIVQPLRGADRKQFLEYADKWFDSMLRHDDPVRDHATLFWHGFFTTSFAVVRRKYEVIEQHQFLREHALSSFRDLVHGIVRDPAMLQYLDNNTNVKGHANENLARELMELFSLGEGHYTEVDVREAARALTGAWADPEGRFQFQAENHDDAAKTILGRTGKFRGEELVDVILEQEACPRWVARKLLAYFEGVEPSEARVADYAAFLRANDLRIDLCLKRLFLDPAFYRDEIVNARVQGPIEYVIGMCRKLSIQPPRNFVFAVTADLGQCFYDPPTVKGWDGGEAWITNATLLGRGNVAGVLVGAFEGVEPASDMALPMDDDLTVRVRELTIAQLEKLAHVGDWQPALDLAGSLARAGARTDDAAIDWMLSTWLSIEPPAETRAVLAQNLALARRETPLGDAPLADGGPEAEKVLRRLAHVVFSLPEAQLN